MQNALTCYSDFDLPLQLMSGQYVCQYSHQGSPMIDVEIVGIPVDCTKHRSKVVSRNALNPIWNEMYTFQVRGGVKEQCFFLTDEVAMIFQDLTIGLVHVPTLPPTDHVPRACLHTVHCDRPDQQSCHIPANHTTQVPEARLPACPTPLPHQPAPGTLHPLHLLPSGRRSLQRNGVLPT